MARSNVNMNYDDLKKLRDQLAKIDQTDEFFNACAKELAARLLAKVIKRTPVGDYRTKEVRIAKRDGKKHKKGEKYTVWVKPASGKTGGTLRRGWTAGQNSNARAYAESLSVHRVGTDFVIDIINPVEYASYVEYGHRTANHKKWVEGKFMLTLSEKEIASMAPRILERKLEDYLRRCFS